MAEPVQPNVYDRPRNLLALLGSWWAEDYAGKEQVAALVQGKAQVESQTVLDTLNAIASVSRETVPIYHTDNWYAYYLREDERNDAQTSLLHYDAGAAYDAGYAYDVPVASVASAFPKPADLVGAKLIVNRFMDPTLLWSSGVDYVITDDAIIFATNPFDDVRVAKRAVPIKGGTETVREAILWIFKGDFDFETIYQQFGYVVGARMASSLGYRELTNALWDSMVGGTTKQSIYRAFSAMTGVPLVRETTETVQVIDSDAASRLVITDLNVYKFDLTATPVVAVGDVVHRGQTLCDTLTVHEFNCGQLPAGLNMLALGRGFIASCFYGDLVFENKDVPLVVDSQHPSGFTKVSWALGGFPLDVERFFDEMHERGIAAATTPDPCEDVETVRYPANDCDEEERFVRRATMAHLLDQRSTRTGEPRAAHLPRTINPLKFLVENVLRNNFYLVRVKVNALGSGSIGLHHARLLQKVVPPTTAMLLVMEIDGLRDVVDETNYHESITTYNAMEPLRDEVTPDLVRERVTMRQIHGTCY